MPSHGSGKTHLEAGAFAATARRGCVRGLGGNRPGALGNLRQHHSAQSRRWRRRAGGGGAACGWRGPRAAWRVLAGRVPITRGLLGFVPSAGPLTCDMASRWGAVWPRAAASRIQLRFAPRPETAKPPHLARRARFAMCTTPVAALVVSLWRGACCVCARGVRAIRPCSIVLGAGPSRRAPVPGCRRLAPARCRRLCVRARAARLPGTLNCISSRGLQNVASRSARDPWRRSFVLGCRARSPPRSRRRAASRSRRTCSTASRTVRTPSPQMTLCFVVPVGGTRTACALAASSAAARAAFLLLSSSMGTPWRTLR